MAFLTVAGSLFAAWALIIIVVGWLLRRREEVDSCCEREYRDPLIADITDRIHGGGI